MPDSVTTHIILDNRVKKGAIPDPDKKFPVKLRVTFNRERKYYTVIDPKKKEKIYSTKTDYEKTIATGARGTYKDIKLVLGDAESKAQKIINELTVFSFAAFDRKFRTQRRASGDVLAAFEEHVSELEKDDRIGTAVSYGAAKKSFSAFTKDSLSFSQVNVDFLKKYEKWMLSDQGNSPTTIGIYCRSLRTILNKAIVDGLVKQEDYPFGKGKFEIPGKKNVKKALEKSD